MSSENNLKKRRSKDDVTSKLTTWKYSQNDESNLFEGVLIGLKPYFLSYNDQIENIEGYEEYAEYNRLLLPPELKEYSYPPYQFNDKEDIALTYLQARNETLDTLFAKARSIVSKYNDQDEYKLDSIASDVIWSYFQDRFATTRYEILTGGVGSGKSALAATFGAIGYRPVNTTNPTAAVIYRLLGNIELGQCTLILEEAEKIDQIYEIMAVLKTGYTRDGKVDRTNPITLKPEFFNSYCFKIIVAERSPNQDSGKGVVDRSFIHSCFKGYPQFDIKEILNPTNTGGPEHQALRIELKEFRKLLLMYRLIHFKDEIPDIDIGIIGRDKELVKPTLQLFQGTQSQDRLVKTFQTILDLKSSRKAMSLHSALLDVVFSAVPDLDDENVITLDGKVELSAKQYWSKLVERIDGRHDEKKPAEYHSTEFGTLYKGTVSKILHDNFGVESKHTKNGNLWTFNRHILRRLRIQLNGKIVVKAVNSVKTGNIEGNDSTTNKEVNVAELVSDAPLQEPSLPSQPSPFVCLDCGEFLDPDAYYRKFHNCSNEQEN